MGVLKLMGCATALMSLATCASTPPNSTPAPNATPAPAATAPVPDTMGQAVFRDRCSGCHTPRGRAPTPATLATFTPAFIVEALTTGLMKGQGNSLSDDEKKAVAVFLTGKLL